MKTQQIATGFTVEQIDLPSLTDAQIEEFTAFANRLKKESHPEDPPTPVEVMRDNIRNLPEFVRIFSWAVRDGQGNLAAYARASFTTTEENKHLINASISVRPDVRRRGIAKAVLHKIVDVAEAEGRTLIVGSTSERVPAGEVLTKRLGAEEGIAEHTNRLVLTDVDRELVGSWIADGPKRAPDYTLEGVDGPFPEEMYEEVADIWNVMNTAPRDNLDMEDQNLTVEQLREIEKSIFADGTERWTLFARHVRSGEIAGYTEVYYNEQMSDTVHQGDTAVRPEHRGHALGKWLKAAMLERILNERPEAKDVRTSNADSNEAMLGINRRLGFEPYIATIDWQVPVSRVREYLEGA